MLFLRSDLYRMKPHIQRWQFRVEIFPRMTKISQITNHP